MHILPLVVNLRTECHVDGDVRIMKINVRCLFQAEAKPALRETGLFSDDELGDIVIDLDSQSG